MCIKAAPAGLQTIAGHVCSSPLPAQTTAALGKGERLTAAAPAQ